MYKTGNILWSRNASPTLLCSWCLLVRGSSGNAVERHNDRGSICQHASGDNWDLGFRTEAPRILFTRGRHFTAKLSPRVICWNDLFRIAAQVGSKLTFRGCMSVLFSRFMLSRNVEITSRRVITQKTEEFKMSACTFVFDFYKRANYRLPYVVAVADAACFGRDA